ncbi:hypothetical protein CK203_034589 [Vitis vinifera]|uniref:Alliinase EGF-like domain-containing protein n=1 Tax=Vitis vinifera TaxID=29760 RepID=A0A438IDP2_VITVI|nr:hypothetical protein CK203_034589 [Vitis vinifera]
MAKIPISIFVGCLLGSVILNILFIANAYVGGKGELSWSRKAAEEEEAVAAVTCSVHGRAYLDGLVADGSPVCECNSLNSYPIVLQTLTRVRFVFGEEENLLREPRKLHSSSLSFLFLTAPLK